MFIIYPQRYGWFTLNETKRAVLRDIALSLTQQYFCGPVKFHFSWTDGSVLCILKYISIQNFSVVFEGFMHCDLHGLKSFVIEYFSTCATFVI